MQDYNDKNKEKHKEYREINKEKIKLQQKDKVQCECGCMVVKRVLKLHMETPKHINLMNAKPSETTN